MKKLILALAAFGAIHTATAQTNATNQDANSGGQMNNRNTTAADERVQPAGRAPETPNAAQRMTTNATAMAPDHTDAGATIGGMSRAEFDRMNMEGNKKVMAITATSAPLSKQDQKLLSLMSMGSTQQLKLSQAAVSRVQREDVKILAQSELEEQTGLSNKLVEIARAKGMTLSAEDGAATSQLLDRLEQESTGPELDEYYVRNSGVRGHDNLMQTGEKVMREAQDPALKALAEATAPVTKMHKTVSQQILDSMGKGMYKSRGGATSGGDR